MKLLIITQKIDKNDPILSFFHRWVIEFAKHFEKITVICLLKGEYDLPDNVKVLSLGKEEKQSRKQYLARFYSYVWKERNNYDVVLSHMNQEYVLLAGFIWWILRKRIYMWRNHAVGDELTDMSAFFCKKIFCTSKFSYTAKFKKTVIMPVGIDLKRFKPNAGQKRIPNSILFLSRMSPVKRSDVLVDALFELSEKGIKFSTSFYGDPALTDESYFEELKAKVQDYRLTNMVKFLRGIPNEQTVSVYNNNEVFVNLTSSGAYDKTIFEAMACGCLVLASNENLRGNIDPRFIIDDNSREKLALKIIALFEMSDVEKRKYANDLRNYALNNHSLVTLAERLASEMA